MRIHFIAIGGSAMHNLAIALKQAGHIISGSDDEIFEPSKSRLQHFDLFPRQMGWHPESISHNLDAVILGMHAKADNPELIQAQQMGVQVFSYPEFLAQHAQHKQRIVIGGSHGKTTITSMVMHVMKQLRFDFDYLVGSKIKNFDVMVRLNDESPTMIFEGDEYLSSPIDLRPKFHWYKPHIALISGIAWDHMNVFPTFENYLDQFNRFIRGIEPNGVLIYSSDDEQLVQLVKNNPTVNSIGYGVHPHVVKKGVTRLLTENGEVAIGLFGQHNLQNLNGARLICQQVGISDCDFYNAIGNFEGAANRLEKVLEEKGMIYFKDFAHAPSKVKATVQAVRNQYPDRKLMACFELHTYSSLNKSFLSEYIHTLDLADVACVYFNPHALTLKKLPMLMKRDVLSAFGRDDLHVFDQSSEVIDWIRKNKSENTVILTMSSGNFDGINHMELAKSLLQ